MISSYLCSGGFIVNELVGAHRQDVLAPWHGTELGGRVSTGTKSSLVSPTSAASALYSVSYTNAGSMIGF